MYTDQADTHTHSDLSHQAAQTTVAGSFRKEHERKSKKRISRLKKLEDGITTLAAHMDAAMYRWLEMVREFDTGNGWTGDGLKSCAHWLNWKCGLSLGATRELRWFWDDDGCLKIKDRLAPELNRQWKVLQKALETFPQKRPGALLATRV